MNRWFKAEVFGRVCIREIQKSGRAKKNALLKQCIFLRSDEVQIKRQAQWYICLGLLSINSPRMRYKGALWYKMMSWKGSVMILVIQTRPV